MVAASSERIVNGIKTRVLHNKDYVEVAERIRIAHQVEEDFEQVETTHFTIKDRWFARCLIKVKGRQYIGTAEIKFDAPKNTPDGSAPYECAETSALGRALAFAGFGTVESIASYEEIARSQPFVAVVEESTHQTVEASDGTLKQVKQAQPGRVQAPAPARIVEAQNKVTQIEQGKPTADLKTRLNTLYDKAIELNKFTKGATPEESGALFLKWIGDIIGAKIASPEQLTDTRLKTVEQYLNSQDAA